MSAAPGGTTPIPGCACDIPSHLYSFSFEPKPDWSKLFSPQPEIWDYLKGVTEKYGLRRYIGFNSLRRPRALGRRRVPLARVHHRRAGVRRAVPDLRCRRAAHPVDPRHRGPRRIRAAPLSIPREWDHSVDLTGKRVAVIGTGASAIQIVPEIVEQVAELQLYQRTPPWVVPRPTTRFPEALRRAFANVPGLRALVRLGIYWGQEALASRMTRAAGAAEGQSNSSASGTSGAR